MILNYMTLVLAKQACSPLHLLESCKQCHTFKNLCSWSWQAVQAETALKHLVQ